MFKFVKNVFRIKNNYKLHIIYKDRKGNVTERSIEVKSIDTEHNSINAFCLLRNRARTFLISSIRKCYDEDTGEIIFDDNDDDSLVDNGKIFKYLKFVKHEKWG